MPVELTTRARRVKNDFTIKGWHVLAALVAFFAVIASVNAVMITFAIRTMPGTEVKSAYESSQRFNSGLEAIAAQDRLGWQVDIATSVLRHGGPLAVEVRDREGRPINALDASLRIGRPAVSGFDRAYTLNDMGAGRYVVTLPSHDPGQWQVTVELTRNGTRVFVAARRILLKE